MKDLEQLDREIEALVDLRRRFPASCDMRDFCRLEDRLDELRVKRTEIANREDNNDS